MQQAKPRNSERTLPPDYQKAALALRKGDAAEATKLALALVKNLPDGLEKAHALNLLGAAAHQTGDYPACKKWSRRAARLYQKLNVADGKFTTLANIATAEQALGEYEKAARTFRKLLRDPVAERQPLFRAQAKNNLGICHFLMQKPALAERFFREALAEHRANGQTAEAISALINIANAQAANEQLEAAELTAREAVEQARKMENPHLLFQSLVALGNAANLCDRPHAAIEAESEALEIAENRLENPHFAALVKQNLATALFDGGKIEDAEPLFRAALPVLVQFGEARAEAKCWGGLGLIFFAKGDLRQAIAHLQKAIGMHEVAGDWQAVPGAMVHLGDAFGRLHLDNEAAHFFEKALAQANAQGQFSEAAECRVRLMTIASKQGRWADCRAHFEAADAFFEAKNRVSSRGVTSLAWANVLSRMGHFEGAMEFLEKAANLFEIAQNDRLLGYALNNLGMAFLAKNRLEEAFETLHSARKLVEGKEAQTLQVIEENLALWHMKNSDTAAAFTHLDRAIDLLESSFEKLDDQKWQLAFGGGQTRAYQLMLSVCFAKADFAAMFHFLERSRSRAFLSLLAQNFLQKEPILQAENQKAIRFESLKKHLSPMPSRRRLTALVELYHAENQLFVFLVRPDVEALGIADREPFVWRQPLEDRAVRQAVLAIRDDFQKIREAGESARVETFGREALAQFQQVCHLIFSDELLAALADFEAIYLVPFGNLHYLPLHAAELSEGRRLIERFQVAYLPTASALQFFKKEKAALALPVAALLVGTDHQNDEAAFWNEADQVAALPVFQHAETVFLRKKEATRAAVLQKMAGKKVVHISSHGWFSPHDALESGLLLHGTPPGSLFDPLNEGHLQHILTAKSILESGLRLDAELLVLSGCVTGESENRPGDELIGLTRALLFAGAEAMVVSLFPTFKNVTGHADERRRASQFARFYELWLGEGLPKSVAFQRWIAGVRAEFPHDYYWFSFALVGQMD